MSFNITETFEHRNCGKMRGYASEKYGPSKRGTEGQRASQEASGAEGSQEESCLTANAMAQDKETARLCSDAILSLLLRLKEQDLKIEFLFDTLGAVINPTNPQLGSQYLQANCVDFVELNGKRLAQLREVLEVVDTGRRTA